MIESDNSDYLFSKQLSDDLSELVKYKNNAEILGKKIYMTLTITLDQFFLYLRYMGVGILMMSAFIVIYLYITPVKEIRLIKEGCTAAALSFGGAILGFCLTLSSSATNSNSIITFVVWGLCSAVVQLLVYFAVVRLIPNANMEIEDNNVAVGVLFCVLSLAIGILNSACLS